MNFTRKNKYKRIIAVLSILMILATVYLPISAHAELVNTQGNTTFTQTKIPSGKTGKTMNVTFTFQSDGDYDHVYVWLNYDDTINSSDEKGDDNSLAFPFEASDETLKAKDIGSMKNGQTKSVSISAKVRRDVPEGYYGVLVSASIGDGTGNASGRKAGVIGSEYINVWISKSTSSTDETDEDVKDVTFVLGEGQSAPYGRYPDVMNFSLNLRNRGKITAQDVTASIVMDPDSTKYPFDINDANYDRHFDKIAYDETVQLPYSMAIRSDVYTGFYPIKINITYRESADGELKSAEMEFYVHVINKDKEDQQNDFNANDRIKARVIVDNYHTVPAEVYAGQEFELVVTMKNASTSVGASNLLFTFSPEKVQDSSVFSTANGSDSIVVNNLGSNETTELHMNFIAKAGIDQRSYTISIKEKYDSPEFKNAEEQVDIDIPVKQIARMNVGTIDIVPTDINVDDESNIMFPINNTGKIILYNVMAKFEADSIVTNETYVGNIKPGETGNVDIMLKGAAPTSDDGKIKITISYEDENGVETTEDKELTLYVNEVVMESEDINMDESDMSMPVAKPWYTNLIFIIPLVLILVIIIVIIIKNINKKKKSKAMMDVITTEDKNGDGNETI